MPQGTARLLQLALVVGLCGGYTTFSTATVESVRLAQSGRMRLALANSLGTLMVTVAAAGLGMWLGTVVSGPYG
jgi:CrcB protein